MWVQGYFPVKQETLNSSMNFIAFFPIKILTGMKFNVYVFWENKSVREKNTFLVNKKSMKTSKSIISNRNNK